MSDVAQSGQVADIERELVAEKGRPHDRRDAFVSWRCRRSGRILVVRARVERVQAVAVENVYARWLEKLYVRVIVVVLFIPLPLLLLHIHIHIHKAHLALEVRDDHKADHIGERAACKRNARGEETPVAEQTHLAVHQNAATERRRFQAFATAWHRVNARLELIGCICVGVGKLKEKRTKIAVTAAAAIISAKALATTRFVTARRCRCHRLLPQERQPFADRIESFQQSHLLFDIILNKNNNNKKNTFKKEF